MGNRICQHCNYKWITRIDSPKSCPRCKRRFDYEKAKFKIIDIREMLKEATAE